MEALIPWAIALVVLYLVVQFFSLSLSFVWNGVIGGIMLWLLNLVGGIFAFHIPINIISALIAGFFGIPGVVVIVIYHLLK
ncbi:MAG: pro-sigmaK processing inhibitor BofA family protein [Acidaminococcaceae bacterium]|nr:pro-sigmaK processing inhibitor BofA family protein [Acidaminococcaceae bacterium]MDD4721847.1 pro-sigmaK processing inhibitor BofA family protein [Acidaminococcaceae bacterium]